MALVSISVARTERTRIEALLVLREDGGPATSWLVPVVTMTPDELAAELEKFAAKIRENGK